MYKNLIICVLIIFCFFIINILFIIYRYFGSEIIEIINPPYSDEFLRTFLILINNSEVFDQKTIEKNLKLKKFINDTIAISNSKIHYL